MPVFRLLRLLFLSTPSARRATKEYPTAPDRLSISIHALREEGDSDSPGGEPGMTDFYPRPPRGGRQGVKRLEGTPAKFLSTPSARRATGAIHGGETFQWNFYPRPPRGGRRLRARLERQHLPISIHALREEGDV